MKTLQACAYIHLVSTVNRKAPLRFLEEKVSKIPSFNLLACFCYNCWAFTMHPAGSKKASQGIYGGPPGQPQPTKAVIRKKLPFKKVFKQVGTTFSDLHLTKLHSFSSRQKSAKNKSLGKMKGSRKEREICNLIKTSNTQLKRTCTQLFEHLKIAHMLNLSNCLWDGDFIGIVCSLLQHVSCFIRQITIVLFLHQRI